MNTSYVEDSNNCDRHNALVTTIPVEECGWAKQRSGKVEKGAMGRIMNKRTDVFSIRRTTILQDTTIGLGLRSQLSYVCGNDVAIGTKPEIAVMTVNCADEPYSDLRLVVQFQNRQSNESC
uniref:Uncharacterized protein n=1 Tax=Glossina pallidipes TaxID=7398 RepID=A0A1A9ZBI8_GLOPL